MQSLIWLRPLIQCCNDSCVLGIGILLGFVFDLLHELVELPYLLICTALMTQQEIQRHSSHHSSYQS